MPDPIAEPRRVRIGSQRYVDTGSGWRKVIETTSGGTVRLTPGEAFFVEERARMVLPPVLPRRAKKRD